MTEIFFDIETVKSADAAWVNEMRNRIADQAMAEIAALRPPGNIKDPAKIDGWHLTDYPVKVKAIQDAANAEVADTWGKTSFDGALGHIAVIGFAIDNDKPQAIYVDDIEPALHEAKLLTDFFYALKQVRTAKFIGHNLVNFDLRFLFQRAVILGIQPPSVIPFNAKPWDDSVFDTMVRWAGAGNRIAMDKLAKALGLPGKQGIDGSMVGGLIAEGQIAKVADYCANVDVAQTRQIYKRMTFQTELIAA